MPVIKSAIKKLKQDRKREKLNDALRDSVTAAVRSAKKAKTSATVKEAISIVDKAAKHNLLHKNKASRMKSSLAKLAKVTTGKKASAPAPKNKSTKTEKPTVKKSSNAKKSK